MKVIETIYTGHDWMSGESDVDRNVEIALVDDNGNTLCSVSIGEGEPEDMKLFRDLSDAYEIQNLVEQVYELGKQGIEITFEERKEEY